MIKVVAKSFRLRRNGHLTTQGLTSEMIDRTGQIIGYSPLCMRAKLRRNKLKCLKMRMGKIMDYDYNFMIFTWFYVFYSYLKSIA